MSRSIHKLNARRVETEKKAGKHGDGGGLSLVITKDGSRRWIFAWERQGKRREMGFGPAAEISLARARELASASRQLLANGIDPLDQRRADLEAVLQAAREAELEKHGALTFGAFATKFMDTHEEGWKNPKHRQQWRNTIATHGASILNLPVGEITIDDIVGVLKPIWRSTPETAGRLRGRIENILDAAKAANHILSPWENPARWRGNLIHLLPRPPSKKDVTHHAAMPFEDLPSFWLRLRERPALAARALELTILCATRTNETLGAKWTEFDLDNALWIIPKQRMKMNVEHRVPLCAAAVALLKSIAAKANRQPNAFVFSGQRLGRPLSNMAMAMIMRRMKLGHLTVHGMRSSFRDYMGEMTNHPESVVEHALAHQVGDEVSRAYRRGDALLKRRVLMNDWDAFVTGSRKAKSKITRLGRARSKAA